MDEFRNQMRYSSLADTPARRLPPRPAEPRDQPPLDINARESSAISAEKRHITMRLPDISPRKLIPRSLSSWALAAAVVAIISFGAVGLYYSHRQYTPNYLVQSGSTTTPQQQQAAQTQIKELAARVGKLISLPQGEMPAVATITDMSKLAGQAFFAKAKNGDQVLIYSQAKKAYLFRPSNNQIINIAAVNGTTGQPGPGATNTPAANVPGTASSSTAKTYNTVRRP
jgi:hypothetical protein